jgi:hypothetical protein
MQFVLQPFRFCMSILSKFVLRICFETRLYSLFHRFRSGYQDDHFRVNFDHFYSMRHLKRLLRQ